MKNGDEWDVRKHVLSVSALRAGALMFVVVHPRRCGRPWISLTARAIMATCLGVRSKVSEGNRERIRRLVMGSVGDRVLQTTRGPLLLYRPPQDAPAQGFQHVLLPLDQSERLIINAAAVA